MSFFPNYILFSQYHIEDHRNIHKLSGHSLLSVIVTVKIYISLIADKHFGRVVSSLVNGVSLIFGETRG